MVQSVGDLNWADDNNSSSDEGSRDTSSSQSFAMMDIVWNGSNGAAQMQGGQLSPASTSMDIQMDNSSAPTMVHSASSSCAESWASGNPDRDEPDSEVHWEQGSDDVLAVPKMEPVDDDVNFDDLKAAPMTPMAPSEPTVNSQIKQKRPRGRPRKHPLTPVVNTSKVTKGRSKTGCITCRKRKKKCDEAKPRCKHPHFYVLDFGLTEIIGMNCEKNAVVCEGYHEKQLWKSGKERAEEGKTNSPITTQLAAMANASNQNA